MGMRLLVVGAGETALQMAAHIRAGGGHATVLTPTPPEAVAAGPVRSTQVCVPTSSGDPVMAAPARSGFEASQLPKDAASQTLVRQPSAHAHGAVDVHPRSAPDGCGMILIERHVDSKGHDISCWLGRPGPMTGSGP